ncbi:MAG TPA: hypothetical protein VF895_11740 [Gaiellaceae bacterium]
MKVFVVHDANGTISSYAIPAADMQGQLGLEPPRGQSVSEIDVPELDGIGDLRERLRHLDEALEDRRVQGGQLVPGRSGNRS